MAVAVTDLLEAAANAAAVLTESVEIHDSGNWFRSVVETLGVGYPQLWEADFSKQATTLDVPIYFLIGRHDINAPGTLSEQYFDLLDAPHQGIVWFEHPGTCPGGSSRLASCGRWWIRCWRRRTRVAEAVSREGNTLTYLCCGAQMLPLSTRKLLQMATRTAAGGLITECGCE